MIRSFADKTTERLADGVFSRKLPPDIQARAVRLLRAVHSAEHWTELREPPGNQLHALYGDRAGQ